MSKKLLKIMMALMVVFALVTAGSAQAEIAAASVQKLDAYYTLAIDRIENDDYEKALSYLEKCLDYCDQAANAELYADVHLKNGCVYTMQKKYTEALAELDEAIGATPELSEAWLVKTQVYSETEDYAAAAETLEKYMELTGDASMNETLSQLYASAGDEDKAIEAHNAYEAYNSGIVAVYESAVSKLDAGQYADAIADFELCWNDAKYGPSSIYNIAVCYMQGGDYENALNNFILCVGGETEYDGLYYNIGVCCMVTDRVPSAIEAFTISAERESFTSDALYNRAICYVTTQEYQLAIDDFTAYLDAAKAAQPVEEGAEPADVVDVATYYRGVCYLSVNEFEKAAADFTACMEAGLAPSDSLFNRALTYLQGGSYELAIADFTACVEKEISPDEALFYRSYAYRGIGDNEAAIADLTACIERGYSLSETYYQRAQVYSALGDKEHYADIMKDVAGCGCGNLKAYSTKCKGAANGEELKALIDHTSGENEKLLRTLIAEGKTMLDFVLGVFSESEPVCVSPMRFEIDLVGLGGDDGAMEGNTVYVMLSAGEKLLCIRTTAEEGKIRLTLDHLGAYSVNNSFAQFIIVDEQTFRELTESGRMTSFKEISSLFCSILRSQE